ncbi:hypothetical protein SAMN05444143_10624 [Flavobacterium succinicans]|jgi:energy-coupling factor transporter transmembrane protein EcfT|uniref:Uncharacterized protein n=1 Tax=Flavobacterium succinicans TaxID=29536 RepID=A0A1I4W5M0_9FLAO|nr:hypothetical protein SAMN05444143_10624 [Flavobacterium succinicans]
MNYKKIILTAILTVLIIYVVSSVVLLLSSGGPSDYWQAFNPIYQHETWMFVFSWSLGDWGFLVMTILWFLLYSSIFLIVDKPFFEKYL